MKTMKAEFSMFVLAAGLCIACFSGENKQESASKFDSIYYFQNPILDYGANPYTVWHDGYYYYTQGGEDYIELWKTRDLTKLREAECKTVYRPDNISARFHMWAPELHRIDGKWYIYYTADDGYTDHHQLYVAENSNEDPMEGSFSYLSHLSTDPDNNWAIHPTTFSVHGKQYLLWSGWESQRIYSETQCIYIAPMSNPYTISGKRVLISKPQYAWERQWISPDGNRSAYPIYVNENPQVFVTPTKIIIFYGASGSWTPYYCTGKIEADINSDLLNPESWHKYPEPVFMQNAETQVYGPGVSCILPGRQENEWWMLYHARSVYNDQPGSVDSRSPRLQPISLDANNEPVLGIPYRLDTLLRIP